MNGPRSRRFGLLWPKVTQLILSIKSSSSQKPFALLTESEGRPRRSTVTFRPIPTEFGEPVFHDPYDRRSSRSRRFREKKSLPIRRCNISGESCEIGVLNQALRPADRKIWPGRYRNGCQGVAFHIEQFFSVSAPGWLASAVGRDLPLSAAIREATNVDFRSARFIGNIREKLAVRRKSGLRFLSCAFARTARIRTRCRLASASDTRDRFGSLDPPFDKQEISRLATNHSVSEPIDRLKAP